MELTHFDSEALMALTGQLDYIKIILIKKDDPHRLFKEIYIYTLIKLVCRFARVI